MPENDRHVLSRFVFRMLAVCLTVWFALGSVARADDEFRTTQLFLFGMKPLTSFHVTRDFALMARPIATGLGALAWMNYSWPGTRFVITSAPIEPLMEAAGDAAPDAPRAAALDQNYPNPFNPSTRIPLTLARPGRVVVQVFDVRGAHVATVFDGSLREGRHAIEWAGRDDRGQPIASGMYFYTLTTNGQTLSRKMLVLK